MISRTIYSMTCRHVRHRGAKYVPSEAVNVVLTYVQQFLLSAGQVKPKTSLKSPRMDDVRILVIWFPSLPIYLIQKEF